MWWNLEPERAIAQALGLRLDIKRRTVERGEDAQPHVHEFDTRLLVLEGQMTVVCGDSQRSYQPGDILAIPAGEAH